MGADLYIQSIHQSQRQKIEPLFDRAVALRDSLPEGSAEQKRAQEQVSEYYFEQLHGDGYFRDPYNPWDLLWKFDLSWWEDVLPRLDEDGNLSPSDAEWLRAELRGREERFEQAIGELPADDQQYFRGRYDALQAFLDSAIERNEPIYCSL